LAVGFNAVRQPPDSADQLWKVTRPSAATPPPRLCCFLGYGFALFGRKGLGAGFATGFPRLRRTPLLWIIIGVITCDLDNSEGSPVQIGGPLLAFGSFGHGAVETLPCRIFSVRPSLTIHHQYTILCRSACTHYHPLRHLYWPPCRSAGGGFTLDGL
jgi:hypothetical protein